MKNMSKMRRFTTLHKAKEKQGNRDMNFSVRKNKDKSDSCISWLSAKSEQL